MAMTTEGRRRVVFAALLGSAILGAVAFMASVMIGDAAWRVALQVCGLAVCAAASVSAVLTVRRWSAGDDFWWPDSEH